jgi:ribosomal protein L40E
MDAGNATQRVYPGDFLRSATRRAKQVRFRRQRVIVEGPPDESGAYDAADEADDADAQKIEVHVHLHRGERSKKSRSGRCAPPLRGVLFDWDWYKERLCQKPPTAPSRWSFSTVCPACDGIVPTTAKHCQRCGAPRSRSRFLSKVKALLGLVCIGALFALGLHVLGDSVSEHKPLAPLGQWTDEDVVIVEVPTTPSPFSPTPPSANAATAPGDDLAAR